jgi:hypothetical protein
MLCWQTLDAEELELLANHLRQTSFLSHCSGSKCNISCMIKHSSALQTPYLLPLQSWHFNNSQHGWNKKSLGAYYLLMWISGVLNSLPSTYFNGKTFLPLKAEQTTYCEGLTYCSFHLLDEWVHPTVLYNLIRSHINWPITNFSGTLHTPPT